jgi:hypothetical protein
VTDRTRVEERTSRLVPTRHPPIQAFPEGEDGIVYDSLRHAGGVNVVAYDPRQVLDVTIGPSFDLIVPVEGRIVARRLA